MLKGGSVCRAVPCLPPRSGGSCPRNPHSNSVSTMPVGEEKRERNKRLVGMEGLRIGVCCGESIVTSIQMFGGPTTSF